MLNKRFFAVLMAAVLMLVCAVPVFAEAASGADVLLIAPAPSSSDAVSASDVASASDVLSGTDVTSAADVIEETGSKLNQIADVGESFKLMGYGMMGIFIVMIIIMVVIFILNAATKPRSK